MVDMSDGIKDQLCIDAEWMYPEISDGYNSTNCLDVGSISSFLVCTNLILLSLPEKLA
jgi:hypothetical protein